LVDVKRREKGVRKEGIFRYFCVLSFFVYLLTPTGHTKKPITLAYGSNRVFPRKVKLFKVMVMKNNVWVLKLNKNMIFEA